MCCGQHKVIGSFYFFLLLFGLFLIFVNPLYKGLIAQLYAISGT